MNLLLALFKYFPHGGLQKDTLRFAQEATRRGHDVTILCTRWEGPQPQNIRIAIKPVSALTNYGAMEQFARLTDITCQQFSIDVSLAMSRIPGCDAYFVADSCMARWMQTKHSPLLLKFHPRYRTYLRHEALICSPRTRTKLLCIAEPQIAEYSQYYDLPPQRIALLPPGMDERCHLPDNDDLRRHFRRQLNLRDQDIALFLAGTNLMRKGVDRILSSLPMLPSHVHFFLAGKDTPEKVKKLLKHHPLCEHRVTFLGPRDDIPDLLQAMDLMVHPAREEGTGTVLIEAIATGLPVICTQACGFASFVHAATHTVVPEPFQQEALDDMLAKCLDNLPALKQQTREYAAKQDFTTRSKVAIDILEQIAAQCPWHNHNRNR